jgi:hypothetical protein
MSNEIDFLKESLRFNQEYKESLDHKASFVLGIASVVLVLSLNNIEKPGFLLVATGALLSSVFSIWVISFPFRKTHKGKFSILCAWGFEDLTEEEYNQRLNKVLQDEAQVVATYKQEIYALSEYSIKIKLRFIKLASFTLTIGLIVGFAAIIIGRL